MLPPKPQTRPNKMRRVATLEVLHQFQAERAIAGSNLASEVEEILSWEHLDADRLREEIQRALIRYKASKTDARERRDRIGAKVDATVYTDET